MLKLIIVVISVLFALETIAKEESWISGQKLELELSQLVIRNAIDKLKLFDEKNRMELVEYRPRIKYYEVMVREIFADDLTPKINEANNTIHAGASEIERITVEALVNVTECKKLVRPMDTEFNSTIETMKVCLSKKVQSVDKFDDETEKLYEDGVTRLKDILLDSEHYFDLESFDTALSAMAAAGDKATSASNDIIEMLTKKIDHFVDTTWNTTFSTYDCDPTAKLQTIKLEVTNVIEKFGSCVQRKIRSTGGNGPNIY